MTTHTAIATVPSQPAAEALAEGIEALSPAPDGVGVMEIEDGTGTWEVAAYFSAPPDALALALLAAAHGARPFAVSRLDDRDWVAQVRRELSPVAAGRFVVHGGHDAGAVPVNRIGLLIEAAMAFGTGHHGTTQGCLRMIDRLARRGLVARRVADIGCGTGVLAMAAARLWHCRAAAGDIDPVAVMTARENMRANPVSPRPVVVPAAGLRAGALRAGAPYDLVLANILAAPLRRLAPEMARHLAPGGVVVLSGLLARQAPSVLAVYRGHGLARLAEIRIGEWTTLALGRRRGLLG